jgi:hypothetical protein
MAEVGNTPLEWVAKDDGRGEYLICPYDIIYINKYGDWVVSSTGAIVKTRDEAKAIAEARIRSALVPATPMQNLHDAPVEVKPVQRFEEAFDHSLVPSDTGGWVEYEDLLAERARAQKAERERDEAVDRAEELEHYQEKVSADFEGDCWRAFRVLLDECHFDWRYVDPEGVTAEMALEHIRETLRSLENDTKRVKAREARLREALEPFAKIADEYAAQEEDDFQVWRDFDVLGATLPLRNFRRARTALSGTSP